MASQERAFTGRPLRLRLWITATVLAALVVPLLLAHPEPVPHGAAATLAALVALSVLNVEIGRFLDGGVKRTHRPHKALSAWSFAAALLLPLWWLLPVVAVSYAHARWRGLRLQPWKWVGSGAYLVLAGVAAHLTADAASGPATAWTADGPGVLLAVVAAAGVFLLVETVLFHGSAYLNDADDETWLRATLRSRRFYATEAAMLLLGGLSAAVWAASPWLLPLLVPVYGLAQQAALHEPLQRQAQTDAKTGLLRYESWRDLALAERDRCAAKGRSWTVVLADLDRFKPYNDTWGHLAGDNALAAVADLLRQQLRSQDLVGRFGGEEFCVLLPDTGPEPAAEVAERLRAAAESLALPDTGARVTVSVGVASVVATPDDIGLVTALQAADTALYVAKERGRNAVHVVRLGGAPEPGGRRGGSRPSATEPPPESSAA